MVIQHVKRRVEDMRERPPHEREAIATMTAVAVMVVLFLGWVIFFARGVGNMAFEVPPLPQFNGTATQATSIQQPAQVVQVSQAQIPVSAIIENASSTPVATTSTTTSATTTDNAAELLRQIANGQ
jgi:predicted PurR-regulated permease PerM